MTTNIQRAIDYQAKLEADSTSLATGGCYYWEYDTHLRNQAKLARAVIEIAYENAQYGGVGESMYAQEQAILRNKRALAAITAWADHVNGDTND